MDAEVRALTQLNQQVWPTLQKKKEVKEYNATKLGNNGSPWFGEVSNFAARIENPDKTIRVVYSSLVD